MNDATRPEDSSTDPEPPASPPSLADLLQALQQEARTAVHARLHLVGLEMRQAGVAASSIVLLATLTALFLGTAWIACMVGLSLACLAAGLHWSAGVGIVVVLNVLAAGLLWAKALALTAHFTFPATLRMVKGQTPAQAAERLVEPRADAANTASHH